MKKTKKMIYPVLAGLCLSFTGLISSDLLAKNLTVSGSTTVLPIAQKAAEVFMDKNPDISISVRGGGSGVGIAALIGGSIDIGDASREMKTSEIKAAKEKGVDPVKNIIANDGITIAVHPDNPIDSINIATLKSIYMGDITNWKKLGGPDLPIVLVSRDVSSGTFEVFGEKVLGGAKVAEGALMLASNDAVATTIAQTPGAIGYIGLGFMSSKLKALKVEGVMPSEETVKNKTYRLSRQLFMYTNGNPSGDAKKFIDFILSPDGQQIVKDVGYITL